MSDFFEKFFVPILRELYLSPLYMYSVRVVEEKKVFRYILSKFSRAYAQTGP
jgi:hypothetical protein